MNEIFDIPDSVYQLFSNGERNYSIISYDKERDNIQSMHWFLELIGATEENIESEDDTQVTLMPPDWPGWMVVSSGCLGDLFSHGFSATEYIPG